MTEPAVTELDQLRAALERERVALATARSEAQHWKIVAQQLDEKLEAMKRAKR